MVIAFDSDRPCLLFFIKESLFIKEIPLLSGESSF